MNVQITHYSKWVLWYTVRAHASKMVISVHEANYTQGPFIDWLVIYLLVLKLKNVCRAPGNTNR